MAVFGGYETVRELYRSGLASSWTARKAGEAGPERFLVKYYQPLGDDGGDDARLAEQLEPFLEGARAHKKARDAGAEHWVDILDVGSESGAAYYVAAYHRRSVQQLISGRVKITGAGLYHIVSQVVEGLAEFKRLCGRPHGNLRPSNVLLTGKSDLMQATVLLTDPAGDSQLDAKQGDVPDFHALGEIIYQLVLHRAGRAMGGWPAPDTPEWKRLGKNGEAWRTLCNRLLNPNLAPGLLTFEDLADDVRELREKPVRLSPKVLVPTVLLILLTTGALVGLTIKEGWMGNGNGDAGGGNFDAAAWKRLCIEFGDWVEPLLSLRDEGKLRTWRKSPYLSAKVLPLLDEVVAKANPRRIAGKAWGSVYELGDEPTAKARGDEGVRQTAEGLEVIDKLRKRLSSPDAWPALADIRTAAREEFPPRGWQGPANYLESLVGFRTEGLADRVSAVLAAREPLADIRKHWQEVTRLRKAAEAWTVDGNQPLAKLETYVLAGTRIPAERDDAKSLANLEAALAELLAEGSLLRRLAAFATSPRVERLDGGLVAARPPFEPGPGGKLTEDVLRRGLVMLEGGDYDVKADPRTPEWRATVKDALANRRQDLTTLGEGVTKLLAAEKLSQEHRSQLQAAKAEAQRLAERLEKARETFETVAGYQGYTYKNRQAIDQGMRELNETLGQLVQKAGSANVQVAAIRKKHTRLQAASLAEYQQALRGREKISATGLTALDAAWVTQRDKLLAEEKTLDALADKVDRVETFLRGIEADFKPGLGVKVAPRPWSRELLTRDVEAQRKSLVQSALAYVHWDKVLAGQPDPEFEGPEKKLVETYAQWRMDLAKLVSGLYRVEDLLARGYLLSEELPGGDETLAALLTEQRANPVYKAPAIQKAAADLLKRVAELEKAAASTDPAALVAVVRGAKAGQFAAARQAYARLGELGRPWPNSPEELRQDVELRKHLSTVYGLVDDEQRKRSLVRELAASGPPRWETYLVSRGDAAAIEAALARRKDFGVTDGIVQTLGPLARYRLAMAELRAKVAPSAGELEDPAVQTLVGKLQADLKALPASFLQKPQVAELMTRLEAVRNATGQGVDLGKAGPAAAGWQKASEGSGRVTYSWPGHDQKLTFARVAPSSGKPGYVCTTEVSVGLFIDVLLATQKWPQIRKLLLSEDTEPMGPRTWVATDGRLALSPKWIPIEDPVLAGRMYAPAIKNDIGKPAPTHPVQRVSLPAAVFFARLLNCRLPTPAEWQAAYQADKAAASAKPYNLRDRSWQAQRDHDIALERGGELLDPERYYPDAGIFWPGGQRGKITKEAVVPAGAGNDGHLWFARIQYDDARVFQHIVGNVAEYVYPDADALTALDSPTAEQAREFVSSRGSAARVLGGSALSPPSVPVDQPKPLPPTPEARDGFSDVGLRLAFMAGRERLQSTVVRLLDGLAGQGYLEPASP